VTAQDSGPADLGLEPSGVVALTRARLAWLQATHRRGTALALGFCLAVAVMLPSLLPLVDGFAAESALVDVVARDGALTVEQPVANVDEFGSFHQDLDGRVSSEVGSALVPIARYATAGPLYPITVNDGQIRGGPRGQALQAAYLDDLGAHVEMVAGQLPPEGLGGGETAVTMARSAADQIGLNLNDRVCMDFAPTRARESPWCTRIVGLWRPLDGREPYWGGSASALQLTMSRYDFFQLAQLQPPRGPIAGVRYWADAAQLDSRRAGPLALQVRALSAQLQAPGRRVATSLDSSLQQVAQQHDELSSSLFLLAALVAVTGLVVVGLVSQRFLGEQAQELALLRARGWPAGRTWWLAFLEVAVPALYGLPIVLAAFLMIAIGIVVTSAGGLALAPDHLRASLITGATVLLAAALLLFAVSGSVAWRDLEPSLQRPFRRSRVGPYRRPAAAVLASVGLGGLALSRFLPANPGAGVAVETARVAIPALAVLCLGCAAAWLPLPLIRLARRKRVSGMLAGWQLERVPLQHAAVSVASTLAVALAVFIAFTLAWSRSGQSPVDETALRRGLEVGLLASFAGVLSLLLTGLGLHYASVERRRLDEYAGLFGHGLTMVQARRSVASEQASVLGSSLAFGVVLGAILAAATFAPSVPTPRTIWFGLLAAAAGVGCLLVGALVVGAAVRRHPAQPNPLHMSSET
jgi:hypothetical protein